MKYIEVMVGETLSLLALADSKEDLKEAFAKSEDGWVKVKAVITARYPFDGWKDAVFMDVDLRAADVSMMVEKPEDYDPLARAKKAALLNAMVEAKIEAEDDAKERIEALLAMGDEPGPSVPSEPAVAISPLTQEQKEKLLLSGSILTPEQLAALTGRKVG